MNMIRKPVKLGTRGRKRMPWSEVCLHMQVADQYLDFEVIDGGSGYPMVQLYCLPNNGESRFSRIFSAPITIGEAGVFHNSGEIYPLEAVGYYYPHEMRSMSVDPLAEIMGNVTFNTFSPVEAGKLWHLQRLRDRAV